MFTVKLAAILKQQCLEMQLMRPRNSFSFKTVAEKTDYITKQDNNRGCKTASFVAHSATSSLETNIQANDLNELDNEVGKDQNLKINL